MNEKEYYNLIKPYEDFYVYEGFLAQDDFEDYRIVTEIENATITNCGLCFSKSNLQKYLKSDFLINSDNLISSL